MDGEGLHSGDRNTMFSLSPSFNVDIINFSLFSCHSLVLFQRCSRMNKINFRFVCEFICKCYCSHSGRFSLSLTRSLTTLSHSFHQMPSKTRWLCARFRSRFSKCCVFIFYTWIHLSAFTSVPFKWMVGYVEMRALTLTEAGLGGSLSLGKEYW